MSGRSPQDHITLSGHTIHNPDEPRHFMRIRPVEKLVRIRHGVRVLAETTAAVRVIEAGRDLYEPALYLPRGDVRAELTVADKAETFCPIKGHATYYDLPGDGGDPDLTEIAWSYERTVEGAEALEHRIAFYSDRVTVEEIPLQSALEEA